MKFRAIVCICSAILFVCSGTQAETSAAASTASDSPEAQYYDTVLYNGTIYNGSGTPPFIADVGIRDDKIEFIGRISPDQTEQSIDATGLAVAPGFINMLSWATESLLVDGASQSNLRQGVTLEVFGEGSSMGPLTPAMRTLMLDRQAEIQFDIPWTTLGEYLAHLEDKGVAPNVASFVGATTVRVHELGFENRAPSPLELKKMQALVAHAMQEGALGVGSSLIYAPAFYAQTDELVALMQTAANYGGRYISHLRSEGNRLLESIEELITIAQRSGAGAEIYHLKISGRHNWPKFDAAVELIETARAAGLDITANMYTYTAGSTGLDAAMPPWVQEGGYEAWGNRLKQPDIRAEVVEQMTNPTNEWENLLRAAGPENTLLVGFSNPELRRYTGKTLAEIAEKRQQSAAQTAIDLVIEDGSRVQVVYFLMSEENVARTLQLPWVSFGSDAASMAAEGVFLARSTHPRAYGNFARVLGKYVRDEKLLSLAQAIRKLTKLPADNLRLVKRGQLKAGYFADIAVFDPARVRDRATYDEPHQYSEGMVHVFVNGTRVLAEGEPTGQLPGRVVRGPGWTGWANSKLP
ncbi:MAG: D-aminoacylase [Pseudomonadaceae bacterium]|nr:D-aminoacylase [Pseudomonadaceae bacterium]